MCVEKVYSKSNFDPTPNEAEVVIKGTRDAQFCVIQFVQRLLERCAPTNLTGVRSRRKTHSSFLCVEVSI